VRIHLSSSWQQADDASIVDLLCSNIQQSVAILHVELLVVYVPHCGSADDAHFQGGHQRQG
jgi:hypothetical protein